MHRCFSLGLCVAITTGSFGCAKAPPSAKAKVAAESAEYSITRSSSSQPGRGACNAANGCLDDGSKPTLGRCDAEVCEGELPSDAIAALRSAANGTEACYERALKDNRELEGKMAIRMRLARGREPCEVAVAKSDFKASETFTQCIFEVLRSARAQPVSGCVDLVLPLAFVRQEVEVPADAGAGGPSTGKP